MISDSGREPGPGSAPGAGFKRLLSLILYKRVRRLVLTHKERLLRFGSELIFTLCELQGIEVVITNQGDQPPPLGDEESAQDAELRRLCERLVQSNGGAVAGVPQAGDGDASSDKPSIGGNGKTFVLE